MMSHSQSTRNRQSSVNIWRVWYSSSSVCFWILVDHQVS